MNILDMYWKCFYFMYSNMYQSPRKSRLLDFHLEISVFRKAWERLKAVFSNVCLSISLTDFPLVHRCFVYVYAGEQNRRALTCMTKLPFFPHTHLIHTVWQEHQEYSQLSSKTLLLSRVLGTAWKGISHHEPNYQGLPNYMPWTRNLLVWPVWSRMKM